MNYIARIMQQMIEFNGIADAFPSSSLSFKEFQLQEILYVPPQMPDIQQIISVHVKPIIKNIRISKDIEGSSQEGQCLTGNKLIACGCVEQKIKYSADDILQSVHSIHCIMPFSSYIILAAPYDPEAVYTVAGCIEDIYIRRLDKRKIIMNVMLLLYTEHQI